MAISVDGSEPLPRFGLRPLRWRGIWLGLWLLGWLLAIALSLLDPRGLPPPPGSDKLGHLLAYAALAGWAAAIFRSGRPLLIALLSLIALGGVLELAQGLLTSTRAMEWLDALANTLGVVLGGGLVSIRLPGCAEAMEQGVDRLMERIGRGAG